MSTRSRPGAMMLLHERDPSPPIAMGGRSIGESVQQLAQPQDSVAVQGRVVADVEAVEVNVIGVRARLPRILPKQPPQVGLTELIAAARRAAAKLHTMLP